MTTKFNKAIKIVQDDGVFLIANTKQYSYFAVRSPSNKVYDVIFDKSKGIYSCSCMNIRLTSCSHIEAVILFQYKKNEN